MLKDRGVDVTRTRGCHWRAEPDGHVCVLSSIPSDHRSLRNTIVHIQRDLGVDLRR